MAKKIDWLYHRKNCMTCSKAESYREEIGTTVGEIVDATKNRFDAAGALKLLKGIDRIVAAKGKKVDVLNLKDKPGDEAILALLMGPTGNLRAPTAKVGKTLLVGFNDEAYAAELK